MKYLDKLTSNKIQLDVKYSGNWKLVIFSFEEQYTARIKSEPDLHVSTKKVLAFLM